MCLTLLPACMYVQHMSAWCPWNSEDGIESAGTGVKDSCELPWWAQETDPGFSARAASAVNL